MSDRVSDEYVERYVVAKSNPVITDLAEDLRDARKVIANMREALTSIAASQNWRDGDDGLEWCAAGTPQELAIAALTP